MAEGATTVSSSLSTAINYPDPLAIKTTYTHDSERTAEGEMTAGSVRPSDQRIAKRRIALVAGILKDEALVAKSAGNHGLTDAEVEEWGEKFL